MRLGWLGIVGTVLLGTASTAPVTAAEPGPFARIAILRPHDGDTVDFEAGYIRHLDWHRRAGDTWVWYGWNVTFGERQRWFVYASFGHSATSLDNPVAPTDDERDNILKKVLGASQSTLQGETLWYRMVAGGTAPRYVRLRPRATLSAILAGSGEQALPDKVKPLIAQATVEILTLRPTMSYGLSPAGQDGRTP